MPQRLGAILALLLGCLHGCQDAVDGRLAPPKTLDGTGLVGSEHLPIFEHDHIELRGDALGRQQGVRNARRACRRSRLLSREQSRRRQHPLSMRQDHRTVRRTAAPPMFAGSSRDASIVERMLVPDPNPPPTDFRTLSIDEVYTPDLPYASLAREALLRNIYLAPETGFTSTKLAKREPQ